LKELHSVEIKKILINLSKACKIKRWPGENNRPMLSWNEISEMARQGVSFGSHTVSHPVLSAISNSQAREEIIKSKKTIEKKIQKPVTTFAYPFGKEQDYNNNTLKILKAEGFKYACTTTTGYELLPVLTPLTLKRKGVPTGSYVFF
jgi:peptidoglycan/xylan/chitin deacetylase (PgdA/CDA1 family)